MAGNHPLKPTNAELEILGVLWRRGPCTVREVHEELAQDHETGYTTVLKLLQIMAEKGLVVREPLGRAHVYQAAPSQEATQRSLVDDLMRRAFGGSAEKLVLHALTSKKASADELQAVRRLLDELQREQNHE